MKKVTQEFIIQSLSQMDGPTECRELTKQHECKPNLFQNSKSTKLEMTPITKTNIESMAQYYQIECKKDVITVLIKRNSQYKFKGGLRLSKQAKKRGAKKLTFYSLEINSGEDFAFDTTIDDNFSENN